MGEMLTLSEVQKYLGIGRSKVYALAHDPSFPAVRIGKIIRVPRTALETWITKQTGGVNGGISS